MRRSWRDLWVRGSDVGLPVRSVRQPENEVEASDSTAWCPKTRSDANTALRGLPVVILQNSAQALSDLYASLAYLRSTADQGVLQPMMRALGIAVVETRREDPAQTLLSSGRTAPDGLAAVAVVRVLGHELPVPSQGGVGREALSDPAEDRSVEDLALDRQKPPLVVGR